MDDDITKLIMTTDNNAFKNESVQRGILTIPGTIPAGVLYTTDIQFTLTEVANFIQAYTYATDYQDYFNYLDSGYHDAWRQSNNSTTASGDFLLFTSGGLYPFTVRLIFSGNFVTARLQINNVGGAAKTVDHPTYQVPVTFIEYTLER